MEIYIPVMHEEDQPTTESKEIKDVNGQADTGLSETDDGFHSEPELHTYGLDDFNVDSLKSLLHMDQHTKEYLQQARKRWPARATLYRTSVHL